MNFMQDLTKGNVTTTMLWFSLPLMLGNLLQQFYNIADTFIVGRYLGAAALAAVGSAYTLMVFLNSIFIGLCMGCSVLFSISWGKKDFVSLHKEIYISLLLIGTFALLLTAVSFIGLDEILLLLQVPEDVYSLMREYLWYIFIGMFFTFIYNYVAFLLRAIGDSVIPLVFLGIASVVNIVLDFILIVNLQMGVSGAAVATLIAQAVSALGIGCYILFKYRILLPAKSECKFNMLTVKSIIRFSLLTCMQQSVMNFGILMVQGLVNTFGTAVMAAFTVAVKIDTLAYMPVQDFGNAFSTFIAQNFGARKLERIKKGIKSAFVTANIFSVGISIIVFLFAEKLMEIFVDSSETDIIAIGAEYLRIEGSFYFGIGCLFLFYGLYRAVKMPEISIVLTVISLGTRVLLAYALATVPAIGVLGIWAAIPIGWILADLAGWWYYIKVKTKIYASFKEKQIL